jgi:hypothetical protein
MPNHGGRHSLTALWVALLAAAVPDGFTETAPPHSDLNAAAVQAVEKGDAGRVESLLAQGADPSMGGSHPPEPPPPCR